MEEEKEVEEEECEEIWKRDEKGWSRKEEEQFEEIGWREEEAEGEEGGKMMEKKNGGKRRKREGKERKREKGGVLECEKKRRIWIIQIFCLEVFGRLFEGSLFSEFEV